MVKNIIWGATAGFFLFVALYYHININSPLPKSYYKTIDLKKKTLNQSKLPKTLEIPKVGLTLGINQTTIFNGKWGISKNSASHIILSSIPGEKGNIIIYGHNKTDQLKKLHDVLSGDIIKIVTADGFSYNYKIVEKSVVEPDRVDFLYPTKDEVLTLYTCTGFADSKRLVVRAVPILQSLELTSFK